MTRDQAREAGTLAEALEDVEAAMGSLDKHIADNPDDDEIVGVSMSIGHSDAGHEGLGRLVMLRSEMAKDVMVSMRSFIINRLTALGVEL